jgi:hypothetical protein
MTTVFTSLSDLQAAVQSLPPVPPGKVRVFRGQTADYETITPAAYRTHLERNAVWNFYSRTLLFDITDKASSGGIEEEIRIWNIWLQAVAQHYGSGSKYLDVSHSLESAAWFALHKSGWMTERPVYGPPGVPTPHDLPGEVKWLQYTRAVEPGHVYAFDVDVWDGTSAIAPDLALVDLSRAPEPFVSPRMLAQHGCLVTVGGGDKYDLRKHRVEGTPLGIAWPFTDSAFVQRTVEEMFPSPAIDHWYRRLLSVPMAPDVNPESGEVFLKRALPVTLYRGETAAYNADVSATESFLYPPLVHKVLRERGVQPAGDAGDWWQPFKLAEATPILLEAPLLRAFAPADSGLWNHDLLLRDVDAGVVTYSLGSDVPSGHASLLNVLLQFSSFEEIFWERARSEANEVELRRGLWIRRSEEETVVDLIYQKFPGTAVGSWAPAKIRFDAARRRMVIQPAGSSLEWVELSTLPELAKPIIVALHLLRALSPQVKAEDTPRSARTENPGSAGQMNTYLVALLAGAAKLIRVQDPARLADWYVMRDNQGEPYTQTNPVAGGLAIKDARAFADIDAATFRDAILAALPAK